MQVHLTCPRDLPVSAGAALSIYVQEDFHLSTVTLVVKCDLRIKPKGRLVN